MLVLMDLATETVKYVSPNRRFESRNLEEALMSGSIQLGLVLSVQFIIDEDLHWLFDLCLLSFGCKLKYRILRRLNSKF